MLRKTRHIRILLEGEDVVWCAWTLLILGAVRVLLVFHLYRPLQRPGPINFFGFLAGWFLGELALHIFAMEFLSSLALLAFGARESWLGWLGAGLSIAAWAGLFHHLGTARQATTSLRTAFRETPGLPPIPPGETPPPLPALLMPFSMARIYPEVERINDLTYHAPTKRRLDLYRHSSQPQGSPILLQVHGGGWVIGDKAHQGLPLMYRMAQQGWLCASISYRLCPRATFPAPLVDVKRAIAWLKAHAHKYGGDPKRIVITGGSAGGHLASLAALTAHQPDRQPGFEELDTSVQGCVAFYGVYDFTPTGKLMKYTFSRWLLEHLVMKARYDKNPKKFEAASPRYQIHKDAPPFLIIHGTHDSMASFSEAQDFAMALREISQQPVTFAPVPYAQHAFDVFFSARCLRTLAEVEAYLRTLMPTTTPPSHKDTATPTNEHDTPCSDQTNQETKEST